MDLDLDDYKEGSMYNNWQDNVLRTALRVVVSEVLRIQVVVHARNLYHWHMADYAHLRNDRFVPSSSRGGAVKG